MAINGHLSDRTVRKLTSSVIVITRNRPEMVEPCMRHLTAQTRSPDQILVVDASTNSDTRQLIAVMEGVEYLYLAKGNHRMPDSRNLGIRHATGDVVAFLDDDSMAHPDWLEELMTCYDAPEVGGAGGRAIDANEPTLDDPTQVGRLTPDGCRIDNFNADPGHWLEVDRVRGCNMSFRRAVLLALGGFDAGYTGTNVNEASDMCLRVRHAGYTIRYNPKAAVDHLSAPREDLPRSPHAIRTQYYVARNTAYLLMKNGFRSPLVLIRLYGQEPLSALKKAVATPGWYVWAWAAAHCLGKLSGTLAALARRRIDRTLQLST